MRRIIKIASFLIFYAPYLCIAEYATAENVEGDVFLLTSQNGWERVYQQEKFNQAIRIKTEKGGNIQLGIGKGASVDILENSMFELNESFFCRTSRISITLFYGSFEIKMSDPSIKMMIITPCNLYLAEKAEFVINLNRIQSIDLKTIRGKVFDYKPNEQENNIKCKENLPPDLIELSKFYADNIIRNVEFLDKLIMNYQSESERFDQIVEKIFVSRKKNNGLQAELEKAINNIFDIFMEMNITKSRINIYSFFLRDELEENNTADEESNADEIGKILKSVRGYHQKVNQLKSEYNRIITSGMYSILKTYDSTKNGGRRK